MAKRYQPLLPSSSRSSTGTEQSETSSQQLKRRRSGVAVACNACRRKKIRCDGIRPACSTCRGIAIRCTYRDDYKLTTESQKLLVEVMRILNALPEREALLMLRSLKSETDAAVILSTLRDGVPTIRRPSELRNAVAIMDNSFQTLELESQNPNAYPFLPPMIPQTLPEDAYHQLTTLDGQSAASASSQRSLWDTAPTASKISLCDSRLFQLNISHWTNVPISNEAAARAISLYLETDHPLLGYFDPNLFVSDLVNLKHDYCSPMLVNALLYWACQMYSAVDPNIDVHAAAFCAEAESIWKTEREHDAITNLAAALFLSLGYLGQGRDHAVLSYISQATKMAVRLGLFGVENNDKAKLKVDKLATEAASAYLYAAWGSFNWISLMSLFYRQPGLEGPKYPPHLPIPGFEHDNGADEAMSPNSPGSQSQLPYMGGVFPYLCKFWSIMYGVSLAYNDNQSTLNSSGTLNFAEYKFRELLAWSNTLPSHLLRVNRNPHYVQVLHIWFHTAVLCLFKPSIQQFGISRLRALPKSISSPELVYAASISQLKQLVVNYRLHFASSTYTILWHTALIYLANEILSTPKDDDWFFYFLLCVYGYEQLRRSWRVTASISRALLSMALRKGDITSGTARRILKDLQSDRYRKRFGEIRATFMADLDLAESDPGSATVEKQAGDFEHNAMLRDYTNILDEDEE
ncbi:fungal zn(2)-Cys(6) binuclear cluster domain-containing protein [Trichoderma breve]|uniref:Fungal zn(2)-Cys(6) binuclear cluster domain-containing protein n=1 Tax=Trichoderma breve TaxID=2034170 RepID=A0A9W9EBD7_9HYPO|nr:fungal zn(2)-Cys(6) binuclear cluster domain-containing protein [Trichoderma breve]KAJ4863569.1 fungal zn(2)-Cys(6) binuclear cluster domain-containing protein [Trichoderma breve]